MGIGIHDISENGGIGGCILHCRIKRKEDNDPNIEFWHNNIITPLLEACCPVGSGLYNSLVLGENECFGESG